MSTSIAKNIGDKRELYANDQAYQRRIQLKNLAREDVEAQVKWRQKQMDLYNNLITVTQSPTMAQIITSEYKEDDFDPQIEMQKGLANLLKIANAENAQYILDRLDPQDIFNMNVNFGVIVREIQKNNKRLDKKLFITKVKDLIDEKVEDHNLSAQGQLNLDALTEQQIQQEAIKLAQEKQFDDTQGAMERLADLNTEAKKDALRQARIQELTQRNQGVRLTRSMSAYMKNRTPVKAQQPLQTTDISLQEATDKPSQSTAPPNTIQADVGDIKDIDRVDENKIVYGDEHEIPLPYEEVKPYLDLLHKQFPKAKDLHDFVKIKYNPLYLMNPYTNKKLSTSELYTRLAIDAYKVNKFKTALQKDIFMPQKQNTIGLSKQVNLDIQEEGGVEGSGLKRVKRIVGRGKPHFETTLSKRKYISDDKFYLDTRKLNDNILSVKYAKTDANIPMLRPQSISTDLKEVIQDAIEGKYDNRIFKKLSETDKRVFKRFVTVCKIHTIEIDDPDDKLFQQRFEILKGQFLAGNSSPQNKQELKKCILEAYASNKIPRNECMLLLYEISL